ncbi:hypothetical protein J2T18_004949 [Paenibacillus polymyxa]|nr:hypothetical protein [Paenibacillus polymyxa]
MNIPGLFVLGSMFFSTNTRELQAIKIMITPLKTVLWVSKRTANSKSSFHCCSGEMAFSLCVVEVRKAKSKHRRFRQVKTIVVDASALGLRNKPFNIKPISLNTQISLI